MKSYRTDYSRVAGLGSAKDGVRHWWLQRLTSIALIPLSFPFVYVIGSSLGADRETVIAHFDSPFFAISSILFLMVGFHHLQQGLQVVIEDYVHNKTYSTILFVLNFILCWGFAVAGVFSLARMSFGLAA